MTRYIARVTGLTSVEALWFDSATTDEEMIRHMNITARSDRRVIFVKLFRAEILELNTEHPQARASVYLYAGIPNRTNTCSMQHFFYANSHAEAPEAAGAWSWSDATLYGCTEVVQ